MLQNRQRHVQSTTGGHFLPLSKTSLWTNGTVANSVLAFYYTCYKTCVRKFLPLKWTHSFSFTPPLCRSPAVTSRSLWKKKKEKCYKSFLLTQLVSAVGWWPRRTRLSNGSLALLQMFTQLSERVSARGDQHGCFPSTPWCVWKKQKTKKIKCEELSIAVSEYDFVSEQCPVVHVITV